MLKNQPLTFEEYQSSKYFPALDGFRAASCLLIITWHAEFLGWHALNGYSGVASFFVLSGYLITTLALREEARRGVISVKAFYVRRTFRIFPAYFLVLLAYCVIIYGLNIKSSIDNRPAFSMALPYYLFYMNEYSAKDVMDLYGVFPPFFHSWSLGIEEKFYLIWPLLGFALLHRNMAGRLAIAGGIVACAYLFPLHPVVGMLKLGHYACILIGCMLAVLMEHRPAYNVLSRLATTPIHIAALVVLLVVHLSQTHGEADLFSQLYPFVVAVFLIGLVAGRTPCTQLFQLKIMSYLGLRTYGLYLVHVLAQNVVQIALKPGPLVPLWKSPLYFLACVAVTLVAAEILHRTVEQPFMNLGRRISNKIMNKAAASASAES